MRHGERLLALLERECLAHGAIEGGGGARLVGVRVRVLGLGYWGLGIRAKVLGLGYLG